MNSSLCAKESRVDAAIDLSGLPRIGGVYRGMAVKITNDGFYLWLFGMKCLVYIPHDSNLSYSVPEQNELFNFRADRYCRYERGQDGVFCEGAVYNVERQPSIGEPICDIAEKPVSVAVPDCFRAMGFDEIPSEEKLKEQFHKEALQAHPDTGGTTRKFIILKNNYEKCKEYLHI